MLLTVPSPNGSGQTPNCNQSMLMAHAQLNSLYTAEIEKTGAAFQQMNHQIRENFQALADENTQLKERVTLLETELRQERTLRAEERTNTLEVFEELKMEIQSFKSSQTITNANVQQLAGTVGNEKIKNANRWNFIKNCDIFSKFLCNKKKYEHLT